jgi:hypothetical protein
MSDAGEAFREGDPANIYSSSRRELVARRDVARACELFGVSRFAYYQQRTNQPPPARHPTST